MNYVKIHCNRYLMRSACQGDTNIKREFWTLMVGETQPVSSSEIFAEGKSALSQSEKRQRSEGKEDNMVRSNMRIAVEDGLSYAS